MTLPSLYAKHTREVTALVRATLRARSGNVKQAAADLDVSRTTLIGIIEAHGLEGETSGKMGRPKSEAGEKRS